MLTIVETTEFTALWPDYWTAEQFGEFCAWLAVNPGAGDVVPKSEGCRKVRWTLPGGGKRGGVRVIYFTRLSQGEIWLITMYAKNERSTIKGKALGKKRRKVDDHRKR